MIRCMYPCIRLFEDAGELYILYCSEIDSYLELETKFEELIRQTLSVKRLEWQEHPENMDKLVSETLEDFKAAYTQ